MARIAASLEILLLKSLFWMKFLNESHGKSRHLLKFLKKGKAIVHSISSGRAIFASDEELSPSPHKMRIHTQKFTEPNVYLTLYSWYSPCYIENTCLPPNTPVLYCLSNAKAYPWQLVPVIAFPYSMTAENTKQAHIAHIF